MIQLLGENLLNMNLITYKELLYIFYQFVLIVQVECEKTRINNKIDNIL